MSAIAKFMDILNQRTRMKENLCYPFKIYEDLNRAHIVLPSKTTDRIKRQQGAFIYPKYVNTNNKIFEEIKKDISYSINSLSTTLINNKGENFSVIKISGGRKKIRNELARTGITKGFIYPEIEYQSQAILQQLTNN